MSELCQYEIDVLRSIAGEEVPHLSWGAAMGVAVEGLKARGLIFRNHEHAYKLTDEGRAVLYPSVEQNTNKA